MTKSIKTYNLVDLKVKIIIYDTFKLAQLKVLIIFYQLPWLITINNINCS